MNLDKDKLLGCVPSNLFISSRLSDEVDVEEDEEDEDMYDDEEEEEEPEDDEDDDEDGGDHLQ